MCVDFLFRIFIDVGLKISEVDEFDVYDNLLEINFINFNVFNLRDYINFDIGELDILYKLNIELMEDGEVNIVDE